jgi:hypothetical protein
MGWPSISLNQWFYCSRLSESSRALNLIMPIKYRSAGIGCARAPSRKQEDAMHHSERQQQCNRAENQERLAMPDFYMPAMWPVELQQALVDRFIAWRNRRLYRRLLRLSDRELRMRDLSRPRLIEKARMPLHKMVAELACERER